MKQNSKEITRRKFIGTTGAVAAGLTVVPSTVVSGLGHRAPSDKLNIAVVGIGGMGNSNLKAVSPTENIVALCDVDWGYSKEVFAQILPQNLTGTGGKCTTKWASRSMR